MTFSSLIWWDLRFLLFLLSTDFWRILSIHATSQKRIRYTTTDVLTNFTNAWLVRKWGSLDDEAEKFQEFYKSYGENQLTLPGGNWFCEWADLQIIRKINQSLNAKTTFAIIDINWDYVLSQKPI